MKRFHKESDAYFSSAAPPAAQTRGEFYRLNQNSHSKLWKRLEPIDVPAGSLVVWDNRLPHATADTFLSGDSREILYTAYIPSIHINRRYVELQRDNLLQYLPPPAFDPTLSKRPTESLQRQRNWSPDSLTPLQQRILGFDL